MSYAERIRRLCDKLVGDGIDYSLTEAAVLGELLEGEAEASGLPVPTNIFDRQKLHTDFLRLLGYEFRLSDSHQYYLIRLAEEEDDQPFIVEDRR